MARYSVSGRTAGAGSSTLPVVSLYAAAAVGASIVEVGVWNTAGVACPIRLVRLTSTGTPGSGLTEAKDDPNSGPAACTAVDTHTIAPTITDEHRRAHLAASAGAGIVWGWDEGKFRIPVGTANGIGIVPVGTGQVLDYYIAWDE